MKAGWRDCSLGEVATLQRGFDLPSRIRKPGEVPIVTSSGIGGTHCQAMVTAPGVVTGRYGTIGEVFYIEQDFWPLNTTLFIKDFHGNDPQFVASLLRTIDFHSHSGKSGVPGVNRNDLHTLMVRLPQSVDEQRAIAAALSDVDTLLAGLDRLIAKKRDLKQAAMQQLLTGQTRLPGFQNDWARATLRHVVATPITDGPHLTPKFLPTGVPFLSVNNLVDNRLDFSSLRFISLEDHIEFSKKCKPSRGDILFGKAASVGMVALIETDMDLNIWSPLALIRVAGKMHERFVFYALQTHDIARQIKLLTNASSQGNIGMSDIGKLAIPVPSTREQEAIATVLSDMDAELTALEARRDKTRALKQGMMQELLTGRTRLV